MRNWIRAFFRRAGQFLDEPPVGFASLVWFYPITSQFLLAGFLFLVSACPPLATFIRDIGWHLASLCFYCSPLVFLLCVSRWFRGRVVLMLFVWFIGLNLFFILGNTQGTLTTAISRAFSAAVARGAR